MRIGVRATASPPPPSQSRVSTRPTPARRSRSKERRSSKDGRSTHSTRRDRDHHSSRRSSGSRGAVRRLEDAIFSDSDHEQEPSAAEVQRELGRLSSITRMRRSNFIRSSDRLRAKKERDALRLRRAQERAALALAEETAERVEPPRPPVASASRPPVASAPPATDAAPPPPEVGVSGFLHKPQYEINLIPVAPS